MRENIYSAVITSPVGNLGIKTEDGALIGIEFLSPQEKTVLPKDAFTKDVVKQLQQYFKNSRFQFDLPLQLSVTPFQRGVLDALQKIPTGETRHYGELAESLNSGARAVANACRRNPISIIIPCHRVVAKQGLGGFSGSTSGQPMEVKRWLLAHECVG